eukprot:scaffold6829_cov171-Amphora_coffeaeformis.AAC.11
MSHGRGKFMCGRQSIVDTDSYLALVVAGHGSRDLARRRRIANSRIQTSYHGGSARSLAIGTNVDAVAATKFGR